MKSIRAIWLVLLIATAPALAPVFAQEEPEATKQTVAMSAEVGKKMLEIQAQVEAKDYSTAMAGLNKLRTRKNLSPYETAQIWNLTAYMHYLQERYTDALNAYENVMAQPDLPEALQQSTLKTMSQLYFTQDNYEKALETVRRLMAIVPDPSGDVYMLLGQALYQLNRYQEAIQPIRTAINKYREQGKTPKENWLLLLRVCYYELGDYNGMIRALTELIRYYPKDQYLLTLAGAYSELGDTKKQLVITEVLYEKGLLERDTHVKNLANLYLMHGLPYKAAQVLEKEIGSRLESDDKNLRLLSQAWYQAREDRKAIPPLRQAAQLADDGELFVRLAQSHINLEQWDEAIEAVRQGLSKGGVKRTDQANLLLGTALLNKKRLTDARNAFERAMADERSARAARQWIAFVDSELKRKETLEQVLPDREVKEEDELLKQIPSGGEG